MTVNSTEFMDLLDCNTADDVYLSVRKWISSLTDHDHLVGSTILSIHAEIERNLKGVLYTILVSTVLRDDDDAAYQKRCEEIEKMVMKMSFGEVHRLLKPSLTSYSVDISKALSNINTIRNHVAHLKPTRNANYKDRNPFIDADCLAEIFVDARSVSRLLSRFVDKAVIEPQKTLEYYIKQAYSLSGESDAA